MNKLVRRALNLGVILMGISVVVFPVPSYAENMVGSISLVEEQPDICTAASDSFEYRVEDDGTIEITGYTGNESDVVIPKIIAGKTVASITGLGYDNLDKVTSITIPDSIKKIGQTEVSSNLFEDCANLNKIVVDKNNKKYASVDGVLYYKDMMALLACPRAKKSISIPYGVVTIGYSAFSGCEKLTKITLPETVKNIENYAFRHCDKLNTINLSDSIEFIGRSAFLCCGKLKQVYIPQHLTEIYEGSFEGLYSVKGVSIPEGIQVIRENAFRANDKMESIVIPKSVTKIDETSFDGCKVLTIFGETNSYAEKYAKEHNIPFKKKVALSKPAMNSVASTSAKTINVKWKKNSNAAGYEVQYALKGDFSGAKTVKVKGASKTSTTIKSLKSGKTYYVRVRAYKTVNSATFTSDWSAKKSVVVR